MWGHIWDDLEYRDLKDQLQGQQYVSDSVMKSVTHHQRDRMVVDSGSI